jgi:hypothetical protein
VLVHVHNQLIELTITGLLVGLLLATVVGLNHETGGVLGIVSGCKETFVQDGRKHFEEAINRNAELCFRVDSASVRSRHGIGRPSIILVHILTTRATGSTVGHFSKPVKRLGSLVILEPFSCCVVVIFRKLNLGSVVPWGAL